MSAALVFCAAGLGGLLPSLLKREAVVARTTPAPSGPPELELARLVICQPSKCPKCQPCPEEWSSPAVAGTLALGLNLGACFGICGSACCGAEALSTQTNSRRQPRPLARSAWEEGSFTSLPWK